MSTLPAPARAGPVRALAPLLLALLAFLCYAVTSPGLTRGDAAGVYATAAALVERGRPALDGATGALAPAPVVADAPPAAYGPLAYAAGHYYHDALPGPALLAAPLYSLGLALAGPLGPETPPAFVALLGPLLGALTLLALWRLLRRFRASRGELALLLPAYGFALWPLAQAPTAPLVLAALLCWLLPPLLDLRRGDAAPLAAFAVGAGLGAFLLVDYLAGLLGGLAMLVLLARFCRAPAGAAAGPAGSPPDRRRAPGLALALLAGWLVPALVLSAYATLSAGRPWGLPFRYAVDPAARSLAAALERGARDVLWVGLRPLLVPAVALLWPALVASRRAIVRTLQAVLFLPIPIVALARVILGPRDAVLPLDWRAPGALAVFLVVAAAFAGALALARRGRGWGRPGMATASLAFLLALSALAGPGMRAAAAQPAGDGTNYAAPFAIQTDQGPRAVWTLGGGARVEGASLHLGPGASAVSPWIDARPGTAYRLEANGSGPLRVLFAWEDIARRPVVQQAADSTADGRWRAAFAAPVVAAGLRLHLVAGDAEATVADLTLTLAAGVRVEPFPDYARAALAFSFDWESAMGGLIHSRSGADNQGEGHPIGLTADGAPSVAEAEARGLLMRDGARYLADTFARHDIRATFYATGYNLLDGNPDCRKFLGDPIYRNVNRANGWGSDYWRTHPWYEHDPCTSEDRAPAWYFGSLTRELAGAGHEIASHTFGHLYVRGVSPDQLEADLALWLQTARDQRVHVAPSFAFPWTSSNSLTPDFFAVFERLGLTVLTRLYPPLRHPFELDRVPTNPGLAVFPDQYLPSTPEAERAALVALDEVLARRGYLSLWAHPDEVMLQDGPAIWSRVISQAAARRERGLWVAPVAEIAQYSLATREVAVTALPVADGWRLTVENRSARPLDGLTLALPANALRVTLDGRPSSDTRAGQLRLPTLPPGARITILARR